MLEKKRQEKTKATVELEKVITEILVANGRAIEPFVKTFNYSGENISRSSLGSLVGVFEIAQQSEDSAYIVNFLASVAKKEYFSNPRRGSIESFEAALHKINLALAELVKHGNIAWLGKFHGVLGVLEKNNFHFSVTGKAKILLLRNESFSEISAGLASLESNIHPIKTFVEISSGRLILEDKIILTSPELFDLLPLEDLEKNALRMDMERFAQFLRTVLINELDMGGSLIVDLKEGTPLPPPHKEPKKTAEMTDNVFSGEAFVPRIKTEQIPSQLSEHERNVPPPQEYIDSKTGHIYVQGDTPKEASGHPLFERAMLSLQDSLHTIGVFIFSQGKLLRKGKKQGLLLLYALSRQSVVVTRKTVRFLRKQLRKGISAGALKLSSISPPQTPKVTKENTPPDMMPQPEQKEIQSPPSASIESRERAPTPLVKEEPTQNASGVPSPARSRYSVSGGRIDAGGDETIPPFMKEKLAAFYQKNTAFLSQAPPEISPVKKFQERTLSSLSFIQKTSQKRYFLLRPLWKNMAFKIRDLFKRSLFFWRSVAPQYRKRILALGFSSVVIFALGYFILTRSFSKNNSAPIAETPQAPVETSVFPLDIEKNAHALAESPMIIASVPDPVITSVLLNNETYLIAAAYILNVNDKKQYPLPAGSGKITFASPMDDLRLIFVYTDTNELFSFSPISHTFTKNTLALPGDAIVEDIGTYLTYLYVLDKTTNQIYRFPRAEGGFGGGVNWLKDTLTIEETAKMALSETIFLAPNKATVSAYFRGRFVKNLESPTSPLSVANLFTHPGLANVYALDRENKRILVWNQDGVLTAQYFSEKLSEGQSITINEKTSEALVTTANSLLSFKITP